MASFNAAQKASQNIIYHQSKWRDVGMENQFEHATYLKLWKTVVNIKSEESNTDGGLLIWYNMHLKCIVRCHHKTKLCDKALITRDTQLYKFHS